jgi:hypothetical protein
MEHEQQVRIVHRRDRHEIAHQLVRLVRHQGLVDRVRIAHHQERVAVGRRLGDAIGAEHGTGARLVLDHDRLAERPGEPLAEHARVNVGRSAGGEGHDDPDAPVRPGLRPGIGRRYDDQHERGERAHDMRHD